MLGQYIAETWGCNRRPVWDDSSRDYSAMPGKAASI
jgi:hypothetical protein